MMYGAYGANLNMSNMEVRCPQAKPMISFMLKDYKLVFNGVADIIKCKGAEVPIGLWKITDDCEKALDKFEGFPYLYKKMYINLEIPGAKGKCMFYVMRRKGYAVPAAFYYNCIAQGYEDFGMDKDHLCWAAREAEQAQELKVNLARKVSKNDDLELGVDWEYDWDGTHVPLTNKAKRRMNNG